MFDFTVHILSSGVISITSMEFIIFSAIETESFECLTLHFQLGPKLEAEFVLNLS